LFAAIDGELYPRRASNSRQRKNHTIEVGIDRLLVKQGIASRLEQSIATALKLASASSPSPSSCKDHVSQKNFACPTGGISVPQLSRAPFSSILPMRRAPACNARLPNTISILRASSRTTRPLFDGGLAPGSGSALLKRTLEHAAMVFEACSRSQH